MTSKGPFQPKAFYDSMILLATQIFSGYIGSGRAKQTQTVLHVHMRVLVVQPFSVGHADSRKACGQPCHYKHI